MALRDWSVGSGTLIERRGRFGSWKARRRCEARAIIIVAWYLSNAPRIGGRETPAEGDTQVGCCPTVRLVRLQIIQ
jgi:hypothetical protein